MKILFLPIDNRPVCYQLAEMIADIHKGIKLILPPKEYLGDLRKISDTSNLMLWFEEKLTEDIDAAVLSLDTIAYGGLIPSRRSNDTFEDIKSRLGKLKVLIKKSGIKVYAFSSIMRISNNNVNEEEKAYWNLYGEKIFKYSYETDKCGKAETDVPNEIINDYLNTRNRNFRINKMYLEWQKENIFEKLIFSKDDCAEYGLNVREAKELEALGGQTKTGANEIPLTLLASVLPDSIKVSTEYSEPDSINLISNYEDVSIEQSVKGQLKLAGCEITERNKADIILYVNNFVNHQGEIVMKHPTKQFCKIWTEPDKPYIIADVRNANGADNNFVEQIIKTGLSDLFYGYSGWNTSANTLGSLICAMKFIYSAKSSNQFDIEAFKRLQTVRFLDDWAYQANVRQQLSNPDNKELTSKMNLFEIQIAKILNTKISARYTFPWNRLFEVEIELN